jgi:hypothetical protein
MVTRREQMARPKPLPPWARFGAFHRSVGLHEGFEDALMMLLGNAAPAVAYAKVQNCLIAALQVL